jgi:hypothetical protein
MPEIVLDESTHTYTVDGVVVPSVTQILRFLSREKQDAVPILQREAAADRGRRVHEYCQLYDYGALPDEVDSDCVGYIEGYIRFLRDYQIKDWLYSELMLFSAEHGYAGTTDRVGMIDGKLAIVDIKCTATLDRRTTAAQIAGGYRGLWVSRFRTEPQLYIPLHLKKDGKYSAKPLTEQEIQDGNQAFSNCMWLHKYLKGELHG